MVEFETRFHEFGRSCGSCYMRCKPVVEYLFYLSMIAYQCYDCISDGINVYQYSTGESLDLTDRNDRVYHAFLFSLIVSGLCALASVIGYALLIIGLSKKIYKHQKDRNNVFKLGRLVVFISLFFQVSLEETVQCVILYYYIVRCSVVFSFWKTSLFICTTLSLIVAGYTFFKAAYLWCKKQDSLSRKYPSCLAPCYNLEISHVGCIILCLFASLVTLALFGLNIATLVDIFKYSEVDVPHVLAQNEFGDHAPIKITQVRKLVKAKKAMVETIPCSRGDSESSHFLGDPSSLNCTSAAFTLSFAKATKKLDYRLHYCFKNDASCKAVKLTNVTLKYSHGLCSPVSPVLGHLGDPRQVAKTTASTKTLPSNGTKIVPSSTT